MASVTKRFASWDNDLGFVDIVYDDVSLLITGVDYQNEAPYAVRISYNGHTIQVPSGTAETLRDVSSLNEHVVLGTPWKGTTPVELPGGDVTVTSV